MIGLPITEGSPEWHAIRARHIGGSEVAGLFNLRSDDRPDYLASRFSLHHIKAGHIQPPLVDDAPGSRIWFGKEMEPTIAAVAAKLWGWQIEKGGYCICPDTPGMGASLDYTITEPCPWALDQGAEGPGVLQIKNSDWIQHKKTWTNDQPPLWIQLQVQHEMACSGLAWAAVVCLVGNNELKRYFFPARPNTIATIKREVVAFWADIEAGRVPNTDDTESTAEALRALYPSIPSETPIDWSNHPRADELCTQWLITKAAQTEGERRMLELKNEIEAMLEGGTLAELPGFQVRVVVRKDTPDRVAKPDEVIKGRRGSRAISISEVKP
jgi:predicted phage-related endonuclease